MLLWLERMCDDDDGYTNNNRKKLQTTKRMTTRRTTTTTTSTITLMMTTAVFQFVIIWIGEMIDGFADCWMSLVKDLLVIQAKWAKGESISGPCRSSPRTECACDKRSPPHQFSKFSMICQVLEPTRPCHLFGRSFLLAHRVAVECFNSNWNSRLFESVYMCLCLCVHVWESMVTVVRVPPSIQCSDAMRKLTESPTIRGTLIRRNHRECLCVSGWLAGESSCASLSNRLLSNATIAVPLWLQHNTNAVHFWHIANSLEQTLINTSSRSNYLEIRWNMRKYHGIQMRKT